MRYFITVRRTKDPPENQLQRDLLWFCEEWHGCILENDEIVNTLCRKISERVETLNEEHHTCAPISINWLAAHDNMSVLMVVDTRSGIPPGRFIEVTIWQAKN